jgi:hypothetical protein
LISAVFDLIGDEVVFIFAEVELAIVAARYWHVNNLSMVDICGDVYNCWLSFVDKIL